MDNDVPSCGSDSFVSSASQNASTDGVRWFGSIGRWVCTHNPFYVISAALVFAGLRISFGPETQNAHPLGLAIGVSSYTMLLAVTSYLLVRYGKVWDDVRSLLLLIVLLLVSLSESVDEILITNFRTGAALHAVGLALAVLISEGLLRGMKIRLPLRFRLPYYAFMTLFFVYPVLLSWRGLKPGSEQLHWALFEFSLAIAGAILTLLPAARAGGRLVASNGTPWSWPWFPWPMFGALGLFAAWRSYSLCISLDPVGGAANVFGQLFLVMPCLAVALLVLEIGLQARHRAATMAGLLLAGVGLVMTLVERSEPMYREFVAALTRDLGASPLVIVLTCVSALYLMATLRGVRVAGDALSLCLALLAYVPHGSSAISLWTPANPWPLYGVGAVQLLQAFRRGQSCHALVGALFAVCGLVQQFEWVASNPAIVPMHLMIVAALVASIVFDDWLAVAIRYVGPGALMFGAFDWILDGGATELGWPAWVMQCYPLAWMLGLAVYAWLAHFRVCYLLAALIGLMWIGQWGVLGYRQLRLYVAGLDLLAGGMMFFALAMLVSLAKAGLRFRWLGVLFARRESG